MESLLEIVAASFARHGIECPAEDSQLAWRRTTSLVQAPPHSADSATHSSPAEPALLSALPDHNYWKRLQGDPAP